MLNTTMVFLLSINPHALKLFMTDLLNTILTISVYYYSAIGS